MSRTGRVVEVGEGERREGQLQLCIALWRCSTTSWTKSRSTVRPVPRLVENLGGIHFMGQNGVREKQAPSCSSLNSNSHQLHLRAADAHMHKSKIVLISATASGLFFPTQWPALLGKTSSSFLASRNLFLHGAVRCTKSMLALIWTTAVASGDAALPGRERSSSSGLGWMSVRTHAIRELPSLPVSGMLRRSPFPDVLLPRKWSLQSARSPSASPMSAKDCSWG